MTRGIPAHRRVVRRRLLASECERGRIEQHLHSVTTAISEPPAFRPGIEQSRRPALPWKAERPHHCGDRCLQGAYCPDNSTLATMHMRRGYWRLTDRTASITACANSSSTS